ncbi:MAG: MFS transporter [Bacilli bacterium]
MALFESQILEFRYHYRWYITIARVLAQLGATLRYIALLFVVYHLWHSPLSIGAAMGLSAVGKAFVAPVGGFLADRTSRGTIILTAYISSASLMITVCIISLIGVPLLAQVVLVLVTSWAAEALDVLTGPVFSSGVALLAKDTKLVKWMSEINAATTAAQAVGLVLAGYFVQIFGGGIMLAVGGVCYLLSGLIAWQQMSTYIVASHARPKGIGKGEQKESLRTQRQVWKELWGNKYVRYLLIIVAISNIPHNAFLFLPFFISQRQHTGYIGFGFMEAAVFLGTFAGNIVVRFTKTFHVREMLVLAFGVQTCAVLILWIANQQSFWLTIVMVFLYGATDALFTPAYAHMYLVVQPQFLGQVSGLFNAVATVVSPLAIILSGWILRYYGMAYMFLGLSLAFALLAIVSMSISHLSNVISDVT